MDFSSYPELDQSFSITALLIGQPGAMPDRGHWQQHHSDLDNLATRAAKIFLPEGG